MFDSSTGGPTSDRSSMDRSVSDMLDVVWSHKWRVGVSIVISLVLGTLYLISAEPIYRVSARVLVQRQGWPLDNRARARHEAEFLATQAEIISSPSVIEHALATVKQPFTTDPGMDPMVAMLENLTVSPVTGTNVLRVSYRCKNPIAGINMVQAILGSYQRFLQEMNDGSRMETLSLLTRSEEGLRSELEAREKHYRELRKQSQLVGTGKSATTFQTTLLERLQQTMSEVRDRRIDLQNRIELMTPSSDADSVAHRAQYKLTAVDLDAPTDGERVERITPSPPVHFVQHTEFRPSFGSSDDNAALDLLANVKLTGTPDPSLIVQILYLAEVRQRELAKICGVQHPEMRAAREQVAAWKDRLRMLNNQAPVVLQREINAAHIRENQLLELYNKELKKAKANDDFLVSEQQELDGIDRLKTIHNSIIAQLNDWQLVEPGEDGGLGTKVVILEAPTIGSGPVWPRKSVLLSLCAAIGLVGGIGMVVATKRDPWSTTHIQHNRDV